jgi:hypothetical protein
VSASHTGPSPSDSARTSDTASPSRTRPSTGSQDNGQQRNDSVAGPAPGPARGTGPPADGVADVLPRVFKVVGAVVAPTTLLTGLLFYFGRLHVTGMFRYLDVNFTVLDLTFQDYLIRSADGLFVPLAVAAFVALVLLWAHGLTHALPFELRRPSNFGGGAPGCCCRSYRSRGSCCWESPSPVSAARWPSPQLPRHRAWRWRSAFSCWPTRCG